MSTLGSSLVTLADWASVHKSDGTLVAPIAEYMATTNEIIPDLPMQEGNLVTGDMVALRTSLPTVSARALNSYTAATKGAYSTEINSVAILESWWQADARLVELSKDPMAYIALEGVGHQQAMTQEAARLLFNGSAGKQEEFKGLYERYATLATTGAYKVLAPVGSPSGNDQTSIWLITWGPDTCYGIYPSGNSSMGLMVDDKGKVTSELTVSGAVQFQDVYRVKFGWELGITVKDPRFIVRGANIDQSVQGGATPLNIVDLMIDMIESVPSQQALTQVVNPEAPRGQIPRAAFYMNRKVRAQLRKEMIKKENVWLSLDEVGGRRVLSFDGIPVRVDDAITLTEAVVT